MISTISVNVTMPKDTAYTLAIEDAHNLFVTDDSETNLSMSMAVVVEYIPQGAYDGQYTVEPLVHSNVILDTRGKSMARDITVLKVPYSETSNEKGITAYIGGSL